MHKATPKSLRIPHLASRTNRRALLSRILLALVLLALCAGAAFGAARCERRFVLAVGWHDEMDRVDLWTPIQAAISPEVLPVPPGAMTLRLPHVPQGFPYSYQWSAVTRSALVDLGRYPVLAARVPALGPGSYAHLDLEDLDFAGHTVKSWRTPVLTHPGLIVFDLGKAWSVTDTRRIVLRLVVGGTLSGSSAEYSWVQFVRAAHLPFLQAHPDWQQVRLEP